MAASYDHGNWQGRTDGTPWMQRTLVRLLQVVPVEVFYAVVALVIPFYLLFSGRARRASWRFFRRRIGYSRLRSALSVYLNEYLLGLVVIDRFACYAGKRFRMDTVNRDREHFDAVAAGDEGFLQLICHWGNPEMAGYMFHTDKRMNVLVFAGETERMMQGRAQAFGASNIQMVPVSPDMAHLFTLNDALSRGEIVTMPADRSFGSSKTVRMDFLGAPAAFPAGPFRLAAAREVRAFALFVRKNGRRSYSAEFVPLASENLMADYVAQLERRVKAYPLHWFNFYDFWQ